ncbi:TFIIB-type zinc finger domain-containing protein [Maritimibacter sp. DP1N21-5]|uniref:TFIIB-type zinc finger domain-containing protein n=1 Tax=Maritimibacter sp. DP1N21-5 TaxID=2836867 RepID=UPI001C479F84|nr:TFIIB-type zinc finger domain-containing protein [Maritimibacter sp. DP1N21-5]MBV7409122.1 TFIIB-type zinc finger domain-containing protein [Maritimibacter sp. DP1N21-5]
MQDETNPFDMAAPTQEHRFPCDQCGADMRFNAQAGELVCDHCGNVVKIEGHGGTVPAIRELDFRAALEARLPQAEIEETRIAKCTNCGAQVEFDADTHARECPFCATPLVVDTGTHRQIKPKAVLPFAVEERAAHAEMNKWLGRLWFAPNGLRQYARKGRRMNGIYVPFWTYDADTKSSYVGEHGTVYYVTKTVMRDGKPVQVQEQRVRWRPASGRVARFFDDILVLASRSLPKTYTDGLAPWNLGHLEPYRPEYLAGFRAEGYTVELAEGYDEARRHMDQVILRDVKFDIGGDRQRVHRVDTTVSDVTFKHILLPVWLAAYKYRGKTYRFVVNGQSGKVQGERPWSAWKIALAVIAGLVLAGVAGYFYSQYQ